MKLGSHDVRPVSAFPKSGCTLKSEHRSQSYGQNSESACFGAPSLNLPSLTASSIGSLDCLGSNQSRYNTVELQPLSKTSWSVPVWIQVESPRTVSGRQSRSSALPEQYHTPRLSSLVLPGGRTQLRGLSETSSRISLRRHCLSPRDRPSRLPPALIQSSFSLSNCLASSSASLVQSCIFSFKT